MNTDPHEELEFADMRPRKKSSQKNLEFDFQINPKSASASQIKIPPPTKSTPSVIISPPTSENKPHSSETATSPSSTNDQLSKKTMSASPAFSQFQQNVQRQSQEQKAVGSLLSGMAIVLTTGIILVAIFASYGGYILYRKIQDQSITVAELDAKLSNEIVTIENHLKENNVVLDGLSAQYQVLKQQAAGLQSQIDDFKVQTKKLITTEQAKRQKLENRIYDLEREAVQQK